MVSTWQVMQQRMLGVGGLGMHALIVGVAASHRQSMIP
jgi:hypothetical protein